MEAQCEIQEERISDMTAVLGELEALREVDAERLANLQAQMSAVEDNPKCANLEGMLQRIVCA